MASCFRTCISTCALYKYNDIWQKTFPKDNNDIEIFQSSIPFTYIHEENIVPYKKMREKKHLG